MVSTYENTTDVETTDDTEYDVTPSTDDSTDFDWDVYFNGTDVDFDWDSYFNSTDDVDFDWDTYFNSTDDFDWEAYFN